MPRLTQRRDAEDFDAALRCGHMAARNPSLGEARFLQFFTFRVSCIELED
jgi:hypothetical protein